MKNGRKKQNIEKWRMLGWTLNNKFNSTRSRRRRMWLLQILHVVLAWSFKAENYIKQWSTKNAACVYFFLLLNIPFSSISSTYLKDVFTINSFSFASLFIHFLLEMENRIEKLGPNMQLLLDVFDFPIALSLQIIQKTELGKQKRNRVDFAHTFKQ